MNGQSWTRVQLFVTNVALEVLRFLVLNQYLLVVKLAIAVPDEASTLSFTCSDIIYSNHETHQHHGLDGFFFFLPILFAYCRNERVMM